jgi:hypothetical protein
MKSLGISPTVQVKLMKKIKNGELLDSQKQELLDKISPESLSPSIKEPVKEYTFPDGSKIRNTIKSTNPNQFITTLGTSCGTGYCNYYSYLVRTETIVGVGSFLVDFSLAYGKSYADSISQVWDKQASIFLGSLDSVNLDLVRRKENLYTGQRALATLTVRYKTVKDYAMATAYLRFYVGQDTYYQSRSGW